MMDVNHILVSLGALARNFTFLKERADGFDVAPTLKANAYGHGAVAVGRRLENEGAKTFSVITVAEGVQLRQAGIRVPIIVLGGATWMSDPKALIEHSLTPLLSGVYELEQLQNAIRDAGKRQVSAHLNIDTGMARLGLRHDDESAQLRFCEHAQKGADLVAVNGLMTHFANADVADLSVQNQRFRKCCERLRPLLNLREVHVSNSAALLSAKAHGAPIYADFERRFARPGLALYGYSPLDKDAVQKTFAEDLEPAMTWRAPIVGRQTLKAGDVVGYGSTWRASKATEIAVVRAGYADGYFRALSGRADVLLKGLRAPVRGRVCMDLIMVDVTEVIKHAGQDAAALGNNVTLLGRELAFGKDKEEVCVDAYELSEKAGTIPYEILCAISARVKRVYGD